MLINSILFQHPFVVISVTKRDKKTQAKKVQSISAFTLLHKYSIRTENEKEVYDIYHKFLSFRAVIWKTRIQQAVAKNLDDKKKKLSNL